MDWLVVKDGIAEGGSLSFDLRDVLRSLGPEALDWAWTVAAVEENGEALEAVGEGWADLQAFERSGERVAGSRLVRIAERVEQVVWGEFRAYRERAAPEPCVRIVAFDGSCFEVWSDDGAIHDRLLARFKDAEFVAAPGR